MSPRSEAAGVGGNVNWRVVLMWSWCSVFGFMVEEEDVIREFGGEEELRIRLKIFLYIESI